MKVLAVTNLYPSSVDPQRGLFNHQLFHELARRVDLTVLVPVAEWRPWRWSAIRAWSPPAHDRDALIRVTYLPVFYLPVLGRNLSAWFHQRALRRHIAAFTAADAILATWLYPDCVAAAALARSVGKPIWLKPHGTDRFHLLHPRRGPAVRAACDAARGLFPNCGFMADELHKAGIARDKLHVVRHGIDFERFLVRPREEALRLLGERDDGWPIVCFVGHLKRIKGPDVALRAFAELLKQSNVADPNEKPQLVMIGDGALRSELENQAHMLGIDVAFLGSRAHTEVALWMNAADCLLVTSRSEGMPNVVLESLASGTPVVSADVGDVRRVVTEGAGVVVSADAEDSPVALAEAIRTVLEKAYSPYAIAATVADCTWTAAASRVLEQMRERL